MNTPANSNTASHSAHVGGESEWESRYQNGDTPWDKGLPHPALIDWLSKSKMNGRVLVPGCGTGHDVRAIAQTPTVSVVGLDIAPSAIRAASSFPSVGREIYILGDFIRGDARKLGEFDWIFEHTCFCAIPPDCRADYVREASRALKAGGYLLAVFFMNPENTDAGSPPFASSISELNELFLPAFHKIDHVTPIATYPGRENREDLVLFQKR